MNNLVIKEENLTVEAKRGLMYLRTKGINVTELIDKFLSLYYFYFVK